MGQWVWVSRVREAHFTDVAEREGLPQGRLATTRLRSGSVAGRSPGSAGITAGFGASVGAVHAYVTAVTHLLADRTYQDAGPWATTGLQRPTRRRGTHRQPGLLPGRGSGRARRGAAGVLADLPQIPYQG